MLKFSVRCSGTNRYLHAKFGPNRTNFILWLYVALALNLDRSCAGVRALQARPYFKGLLLCPKDNSAGASSHIGAFFQKSGHSNIQLNCWFCGTFEKGPARSLLPDIKGVPKFLLGIVFALEQAT